MKQNQHLTPYQAEWLNEGTEAITARLEWAKKTIEAAGLPLGYSYRKYIRETTLTEGLSIPQALYDWQVLNKLISIINK